MNYVKLYSLRISQREYNEIVVGGTVGGRDGTEMDAASGEEHSGLLSRNIINADVL